ncbi:FAD/NAD(P)-binding domain-containing protein [Aureobasidium subglaciale]|nr:FAD/NAD(P)-binding domain-containing protein [Aureobasidium subglaciale]
MSDISACPTSTAAFSASQSRYKNCSEMPQIVQTLLTATGLAAPLFRYPIYAAVIFTLTIFWNHLFPTTQTSAEILLLPTKKPYLAALKPLENPASVEGDHCPTCWDELNADNAPTTLACGHVFCNADIREWLDSGKDTCPVCKVVLFQQPIFQGKDAIAEKVHKARVCLAALGLLVTIVRQPLAFIARHPSHLSHMYWRWDYLNPYAYFTGYGSWYRNADAIIMLTLDILQLFVACWSVKRNGNEWFCMFPGHWKWWILSIYPSVKQIKTEIDGSRHYGWVAWRICQWRWEGSPRSFLFWGAKVGPAVNR